MSSHSRAALKPGPSTLTWSQASYPQCPLGLLPAVGALDVADPVSNAVQLRLVQQAAVMGKVHGLHGL